MNDIAMKDRPAGKPPVGKHDEQHPRNQQHPLGSHPTADDVLDVAVEETFPASDPVAVGAGVKAARNEPAETPQPAAAPSHEPFPWPRGPQR